MDNKWRTHENHYILFLSIFFLLRLFGTFILRGQFMFTFGSSLSVCSIKIAAIYACSHYDGVVLQIFFFMFNMFYVQITSDGHTIRQNYRSNYMLPMISLIKYTHLLMISYHFSSHQIKHTHMNRCVIEHWPGI